MNMENKEPSMSLLEEIRKINKTDEKKRERKKSGIREAGEYVSSKNLALQGKKIKDNEPKAKLKSLDIPLDKPKAKRIQRAVGFENVSLEVSKWSGIVDLNRKAEQLTFPLERVDTRLVTSERNFKPSMKTDLEKEVYGLLQGAKLVIEKKETKEELQVKKAMSLQEIREKCKGIVRDRRLKQRLEHKAARLNKSKSRKYHKILRREKLKLKKQEFETLKQTNPEAAVEILNEIEKTRLKERMDLRHKNSKWLRLQGPRVGQDAMVRDLLKENSEMRKELLEKLQNPLNDKEDESEDDNDDLILMKQAKDIKSGKFDTSNAWVSQLAVPTKEKDPDESFDRMKRFWEERKMEIEEQQKKEAYSMKGKKDLVTDEQLKKDMEEDGEEMEDEEGSEEEKMGDEEKKQKKNTNGNVEKKTMKKVKEGNVEIKKKNKLKNTKEEKKKIKKITEGTIDDIFDKLEKVKENKNIKSKKKRRKNLNEDSTTPVDETTPSKLLEVQEVTKPSIDQEIQMVSKPSRPSKINTKNIKKAIQNKEKETPQIDDNSAASTSSNVNSITDRRLGSARPDNAFLKRKLEDESSDEESDEGFEDVFDNEENIKLFQEEKKAQEEKNKVKDVDTYMAGWGSWGGPGIVPSAKKKRKFTIKAPKGQPNKYSKIGNVIYNEKNDVHDNLRKMMVSELPFPFTTVKDFESSIRQPISRTFVPETVHKKLIAPPIVHKMGKVIYPMKDDLLVKEHEKSKRGGRKLEHKLNKHIGYNKFKARRKNIKKKSSVKKITTE